jgi:hypothetical protein
MPTTYTTVLYLLALEVLAKPLSPEFLQNQLIVKLAEDQLHAVYAKLA